MSNREDLTGNWSDKQEMDEESSNSEEHFYSIVRSDFHMEQWSTSLGFRTCSLSIKQIQLFADVCQSKIAYKQSLSLGASHLNDFSDISFLQVKG